MPWRLLLLLARGGEEVGLGGAGLGEEAAAAPLLLAGVGVGVGPIRYGHSLLVGWAIP